MACQPLHFSLPCSINVYAEHVDDADGDDLVEYESSSSVDDDNDDVD